MRRQSKQPPPRRTPECPWLEKKLHTLTFNAESVIVITFESFVFVAFAVYVCIFC